jgi:ADP-L-glycero-D-manno-heptose 6-epimerase
MIIVTGGAGFIGSNIVHALEQRGIQDIVVCDRLETSEKWRNLSKRGLMDVVQPEDLFDYLDDYEGQVDAIFHMGAISSTTETDADLIMENNFVLSRMLWHWCGENDTRFIYASSAATYGNGENGFDDRDSREHLSKLRPLNAYGWSKHLFDRRVSQITHKETDLESATPPQWCGLKFFNVYGPNEYHKEGQKSVIATLYPMIKDGNPAKLFKSYHPDYEDGGQLRDFVYVKDCVNVMMWLYDNENVSGLFNVGTGQARSFLDLARATFAAAELPENIEYIPMPETLRPKYQYFTQANMDKLRAAGYDKAFTSLEDGIKDYVQNYMAHEDDPYL